MSALVFGEVDPRDYWEPLCQWCGHVRTEHHVYPDGSMPDWAACETCTCDGFMEPLRPVEREPIDGSGE